MNFILKSSPASFAFVKLAAAFWNHDDIRTLVIEFSRSPLFQEIDREYYLGSKTSLCERREKWQKIEDRVIEKISQFTTWNIESLNAKTLTGYIQAVGLEILRWMEYHRFTCRLPLNDLLNKFCWTEYGTIDKQKTAEMLITDENINIIIRYKLACIYCLEEDIRALWSKMPESYRKLFYCEEDPNNVKQQKLVVFWTYFIKGEVDKIGNACGRPMNRRCSSYRYAFRCAAISCNKVATEYFFKKLRNKLLIIKTAQDVTSRCSMFARKRSDPPEEYSAEVLVFLLSQMNLKEQMKVLKNNTLRILRLFLNWPWQQLFVKTARYLWYFIPKSNYTFVFRMILHKNLFGYKDYSYEKIYKDFWQHTPIGVKSCIFNDSAIAGLVEMIMHIKNEGKVDILNVMVEDATPTEKKEFIFSQRGRLVCETLIEYGGWDLVKSFIHRFITSKDDMIHFKQDFEQFTETIIQRYSGDKYTEMKNKFDGFLQILDDFVHNYEK